MTCADLTIPAANPFLNGHERYAEEDPSAEMFSLYAADGTPLEESAGLDTKGVEKAIQKHAGYYVYHCPDGKDYTVSFSLEKK